MRTRKRVLALLTGFEPRTRATVSQALGPGGFEILWTASVPEACALAARYPVDLLLLDLDQPLRAGWGIVQRLRGLARGAPAVILSEDKSAYEQALAGEVGAVLGKPPSREALEQAVGTLVGGPVPEEAVGPPAPEDEALSAAMAESNAFREMLEQRYTAPYPMSYSYRHWGINE